MTDRMATGNAETQAKSRNDDGEKDELNGKPTARNAAGHKEKGYAGGKPAPDPEQEPLPLGK